MSSPVIPKNCTLWKTAVVWSLNIRYVMQILEFTKCTNIHALEKDMISFPFCLRYLTSHVWMELLLFPFTNTIATYRLIAWKSHTGMEKHFSACRMFLLSLILYWWQKTLCFSSSLAEYPLCYVLGPLLFLLELLQAF